MKHLVVCIDGTGNSPIQEDKDARVETEKPLKTCTESNVLKLWCALTRKSDKYKPSELFESDKYKYYGLVSPLDIGTEHPGEAVYFNGVGSIGSKHDITFEGAFGTGTSTRIRDAYRFLAERYEGEDTKIYIFGFSRGAFAARSLAGLIRHVGLPIGKRVLPEEEISALWDSYRKGVKYRGGLESSLSGRDKTPIEFLGLWDTVGSLAFGETFNNFHKISPSGVKHVRHALALDEARPHFAPSYWGEENEAEKSLKEIWFCGAHSNIGGGYEEEGLSNIPYIWMIRELATVSGFTGEIQKIRGYEEETGADGWGKIRNSYKEFYKGARIILAILSGGPSPRKIKKGQKIHPSVFEWIHNSTYKPQATFHDNSAVVLEHLKNRIDEDPIDWPMDEKSAIKYKEIQATG